MKSFREFKQINENYLPSKRNYGKELNDISKAVEEELYAGLEYCMDNGIFLKEELGRGEYWYKLPHAVGVNLDWSNEEFVISEFMPEGEVVGNYKIGKGGYLFGERDRNEHQVDTSDLEVWGMIDLLNAVRKWCIGEDV